MVKRAGQCQSKSEIREYLAREVLEAFVGAYKKQTKPTYASFAQAYALRIDPERSKDGELIGSRSQHEAQGGVVRSDQ